jgi:hypothetical protein
MDNIYEGGFISDYIKYAEEKTDAPKLFHLASALTLISSALSRDTYVDIGSDIIYPNLYTVITAPTSVFRKSTCVSMCKDIIEKINQSTAISGDFTDGGLFELMSNNSNRTLTISDISTLKIECARSCNALEMIFDCPERIGYDCIKEILNPYLSILTSSSVKYIKSILSSLRLVPRLLIIPENKKDRHYGVPNTVDSYKKNNLINRLMNIKKYYGKYSIDNITKDIKNWYEKVDYLNKIPESQYTSCIGRFELYAFKLALLFELSDQQSRTYTISKESYDRATQLLELIFNKSSEIFS